MAERPIGGRTLASVLLAALALAACSGGDGQDPVELGEAVFPWELQTTLRTGSPCYLDGTAEDFDGDGHLDFVLQEGLGLRVRLGKGGRFVDGPLTLLPLAVQPPHCGLIPLAAFHHGTDLDLDLVVTNFFETFVLENQGDGSFVVVGTLAIDPFTVHLKFAGIDLGGDGRREFVEVEFSGLVRHWQWTPTQGFVGVPVGTFGQRILTLAGHDLDGDGECNDLLVQGTDGSRGWFRQPGGGFGQGPVLQTPGVAPLAILRLAGDLDGDGFDDLVGYHDSWLVFHPNSGAAIP